ncbi:MAG: ABC transporter ATP-binding protein [Phycisphaerales bacterium]|nr:ABC transporter ATP-binding protein [Phycisphaerales bacterium]
MIVVDSVTKCFGPIRALSKLSFSVPTGAVCGFLGPNGAGKTTMLRILAGAIEPDSGACLLTGASSDPAGVGYLPEGAPLPGDMTVAEHLLMRCRMYGIDRRSRASAIDEVMVACDLREVRCRLIANLSRGFRQRAGLASVLVHSPRFLLLDEPSSGLDPGQAAQFRNVLARLTGKCTVLLSSHNLEEVEQTCSHGVFVRGGTLVTQGGLDELRAKGALLRHIIVEADHIDVSALTQMRGVRLVTTEATDGGWVRARVELGEQAEDLEQRIGILLRDRQSVVRRLEVHRAPLSELFASLMAAGAQEGHERPRASARAGAP